MQGLESLSIVWHVRFRKVPLKAFSNQLSISFLKTVYYDMWQKSLLSELKFFQAKKATISFTHFYRKKVFGSFQDHVLHKSFVRVINLQSVKKISKLFLKFCQILPLKERKNDSKTNHLNYSVRSLISLILLFYLQHFASFTYLNVRRLETHWKPVYCLLLDTNKRRKLQIFCIKRNLQTVFCWIQPRDGNFRYFA